MGFIILEKLLKILEKSTFSVFRDVEIKQLTRIRTLLNVNLAGFFIVDFSLLSSCS